VFDASERPPIWTPAARAQLARDDIPYVTSLTDAEWAVVAPFGPAPAGTERSWLWPMRRMFDAIQYDAAHRLRMGAPAA